MTRRSPELFLTMKLVHALQSHTITYEISVRPSEPFPQPPATQLLSPEPTYMYTNQVESARCTRRVGAGMPPSLTLSLTRRRIHHETSNITFACCRKRSTTLVVWTPPSSDDNDADELYALPPLPLPAAKTNGTDGVETTDVDVIDFLFELDGRISVEIIII